MGGRDWSVLKLPLLVSLIRGLDERLNKTERSRKQIKCSFIRKAAIVIEFPSLRMLLTGGSASFIPSPANAPSLLAKLVDVQGGLAARLQKPAHLDAAQ